jgi:LysM repeat protein
LVRFKAIFLALGNLGATLFRPLGQVFLRFLVLPTYGVSYGLRRRLGRFYRPAKNRLMFFLTNRYAVHAVVIAIAVVAGTVNLGLGEVRAESDEFGQRSLLYSIVTKQEVEVIEEYSDMTEASSYAAVPSYADTILHAPVGGTTAVENISSTTGLSQSGLALVTPISTETVASPSAPRTEVITYTVADGDTLSTISQQFGISLNTLLWANNLTVRSIIKPGAKLTILPVSGVQHTVRSGETLSAIAKKYNVGTDAILSYNNLDSADALKISQGLIIPGGELRAPVPQTTSVAVRDIFTTAPTGSGGATAPAAGAKMVWPTDLRYIVRGLSWYHTGVDIDCNGRADGTSTNDNYAAMDGIVQFAGAKSGYGYAVEVNHGNGLVTRYGHFHSLYVQKGDSVNSGTPLGRCGSTGRSTGTHLHFEVIANGKFKNPSDYLGY